MITGGFDKTLFTQMAGMVLAVAMLVPLVGVSVCVAALAKKPAE
jgi:hypothetical protein